MAKPTAEERRKRLQAQALESVAARGQFNFRLEGKAIKRLSSMADVRGKAVSMMVREWVLERLESEEREFALNETPKPIWETIAGIVANAPPGTFDGVLMVRLIMTTTFMVYLGRLNEESFRSFKPTVQLLARVRRADLVSGQPYYGL